MRSTHSIIAVASLLIAGEAFASDVDILFPLQGLFFGLILVGLLIPVLPLPSIAAVAALYALLVERRRALGVGALLLALVGVAGVVVLHLETKDHGSWIKPAALVSVLILVPVTWVLLWRGMVKHWTAAQQGKSAMVGIAMGLLWLVGEAAWVKAATAIPPPVLDAGYAARRCHGLISGCHPYRPATVDTDAQIDACVAAFPVCQTSAPWNEVDACCPQACLTAYAEERDMHRREPLKFNLKEPTPAQLSLRVAFDTTHECHPGVHDEFRSRGYQPPPIRGRRTTPRP